MCVCLWVLLLYTIGLIDEVPICMIVQWKTKEKVFPNEWREAMKTILVNAVILLVCWFSTFCLEFPSNIQVLFSQPHSFRAHLFLKIIGLFTKIFTEKDMHTMYHLSSLKRLKIFIYSRFTGTIFISIIIIILLLFRRASEPYHDLPLYEDWFSFSLIKEVFVYIYNCFAIFSISLFGA